MFHFSGFRVLLLILFSKRRYLIKDIRLPHSEIPGSNACLQLTEAYRSLPRPSSPVGTKASTACPYLLVLFS